MATFSDQSSTEKIELLHDETRSFDLSEGVQEPNPEILTYPVNETCERDIDKIDGLKRFQGGPSLLSCSLIGGGIGVVLFIVAGLSVSTFYQEKCPEKFQCANTSLSEADKGWSSVKRYLKDKNWDSELLFYALEQKDEDAVKALTQVGTDLNGRNGKLETPLIKAASVDDKSESLRLAKYFIEHGADLFVQDYHNRTFLHTLVSDGTTLTPSQFDDVAEYLISKNASQLFSIPEVDNEASPLMWALKNLEVWEETLKFLRDSNVDLNLLDKHRNSIFYYALEGERSPKLLSTLVALKTDWRHLNYYNHSLLHLAAHFCYVDGLKYFLTLGLDINSLDEYGGTSLHQTTFFGRRNALETVQCLIENGANVNIRDVSGSTALDYALMRGDGDLVDREKIIQLLKDNL